MTGVGNNCFNRNIMGEDFVIGVKDISPLSKDCLLVDMFFGRESGIFFMLVQVQVDQSGGEDAEENDKCKARECASGSFIPLHRPDRSFATGWIASSSCPCAVVVNRTMLDSAIGVILR